MQYLSTVSNPKDTDHFYHFDFCVILLVFFIQLKFCRLVFLQTSDPTGVVLSKIQKVTSRYVAVWRFFVENCIVNLVELFFGDMKNTG